MKNQSFDNVVVELLHDDPNLAVEMLNGILKEGDQGERLTALRQLTQAFGGVPKGRFVPYFFEHAPSKTCI